MKFLRDSLLLAGKDMLIYFKDPVGLIVGFLLPIALVTVFGLLMKYAFGGSGGTPKVTMHVVDLDRTDSSAALIKSLAGGGLLNVKTFAAEQPESEQALRNLITDGDGHHGLIIDAGYAQQLDGGKLPAMRMLRDPGRAMEDQIIQFALVQSFVSLGDQRVVLGATRRVLQQQGLDEQQLDQLDERFLQTGQLIQRFIAVGAENGDSGDEDAAGGDAKGGDAEGGDAAASEPGQDAAFDAMNFVTQLLPIEPEDLSPPDRNLKISYQQAQSISGMSVMMLLFGLVGAGTVLLKEREEGTLRRLFSLPISRQSVLSGKWLSTSLIGLVQLFVLFVYGELLFRVGLFDDPVTLGILIVTWVAVATSFAMMLASVCQSSKQAEGLSTILILVMSALGGCWFPTQLMSLPGWLDAATRLVPTYWAMTGFQGMMWNNLAWQSPKLIQAIGFQWIFVAILGVITLVAYRRNYCQENH